MDTTRILYPPHTSDCFSRAGFKCDITFSDPLDTQNYYILFINVYRDRFIPIDLLGFESEDPVVEEYLSHGSILGGIAFSDKLFNGQVYSLSVKFRGSNMGRPFSDCDGIDMEFRKVVYFKFCNVTHDYYKYIQTLNRFYENYKSPFGVQTEVYSNIEGGFGILGGAAVYTDSLVFDY
jgi:hypothetical protein